MSRIGKKPIALPSTVKYTIQGNTVSLYLSGGSREETRLMFSKLSEGATVTDPLVEQPFGLYGALNDRFGNRWMFQSK